MKEHPILFNGEMVKAILGGRKTQTRRIIKSQPNYIRFNQVVLNNHVGFEDEHGNPIKCPFGKVGDRLWVRETFWISQSENGILYRADIPMHWDAKDTECEINDINLKAEEYKWKPSIHMPRMASRIALEIVDIRVERLQDITESDARADGITTEKPKSAYWENRNNFAVSEFMGLWESIYSKHGCGWFTNPWVWVVEFKMLEAKQCITA